MTDKMHIRAHHLLCLLGFHGLGYSPEFVKKMAQMKRRLKTSPGVPVKILNSCDEICLICPHRKNGRCQKGEYSYKRVKEADEKVLSALEIKNGGVISAGKLLRLIEKNIGSFPKLVKICGMCGWRETCIYYVKLRKKWQRGNVKIL
jgi:hypothetical protein